ncbi:MAG: hypothetical protein WAK26_09140 [Terracidiphilus sp.]
MSSAVLSLRGGIFPLAKSDLYMAGYTKERAPQMQQRMLDAAAAIPGVTAVGYADSSAWLRTP